MATAFLDWSEYAPAGFVGGAVTVGNFDGVHRGHLSLVAAARQSAAGVRGPAVVVTFDPPPHQVLHPGSERPPLTTVAQRAELLHASGADHVVVLRASRELLALSPEAFFEDVVVRQLGAKAVVEGYDFRFGRGRAGTNDTLRALSEAAGLGFAEVPQFALGGEPVSSSRVRAALVSGNVERAAELLGRHYRIAGTVVTGAKRGRTIGFPTANLGDVPTVLPGNGVYAVRATVDGATHPAAANVGPNPTFGEDARKIEVHLLDFSGDVYGKEMGVEFVARLRETRPFNGVNELVTQLAQDVEAATRVLGRYLSAGFKVTGDVYWGTNGAVEAYVEAMAVQAAARFGADDPLTAFLQDERDGFFTGKVVFLDEWLKDATERGRFVEVLDAATEQLLREDAFTDYGREWIVSVVNNLRARIAG